VTGPPWRGGGKEGAPPALLLLPAPPLLPARLLPTAEKEVEVLASSATHSVRKVEPVRVFQTRTYTGQFMKKKKHTANTIKRNTKEKKLFICSY
jgi:hypothetical protein